MEGLEGIVLAFFTTLFTASSSIIFVIVLLIQGNFQMLLYFVGILVVLEVVGQVYFRFLSKHDITFRKENRKPKITIKKYKENLGLSRYEP